MAKTTDLFDNMLSLTKNIYASRASSGCIGDISGYESTGSYMLDGLISGKIINGGFPRGKITCLAGESGVGKTFIILMTIKLFLERNPTGAAFLFESESAITQDMMIKRGIDIERVFIIPVNTVEDWRNQCTAILEAYNTDRNAVRNAHYKRMAEYEDDNKKIAKANIKARKEGKPETPLKEITEWVNDRPIIMATDSIGNLSTNAEINNAIEGNNKTVMSREKLIKGASRVITTKLALFQVVMVLSMHIYLSQDGNSKAIMSGGTGPRYTASIVIIMHKSKIWNEKLKRHTGNNVRCVVDKGRLTKEGSQAWCQIDFGKGLSPFYGLLKPGIESGVVEQSGAWYTMPDGARFHGEDQIYAKPEEVFTTDYLEKIQPWITKNYCYGENDAIVDDDDLTDENDGTSIPEVVTPALNVSGDGEITSPVIEGV